jgi:hypothetical protein
MTIQLLREKKKQIKILHLYGKWVFFGNCNKKLKKESFWEIKMIAFLRHNGPVMS